MRATTKERDFSSCSFISEDDDPNCDKDIFAFAIAAGDAMSESDDEIFSLEGQVATEITEGSLSPSYDPICQGSGYTNVQIKNGKVAVRSNGTKGTLISIVLTPLMHKDFMF